jgi:(p)ppGpp synthase/HD superfamily hydrolase
MPIYSARYDAALAFAARAHRNQLRKGTDIPYIAHVTHVSVLLIRLGFDEDVAIAGLLHDVVEDCGVRSDEIAAEWGARVAQIVQALSEPLAPNGAELEWEAARAAKLEQLRAGGPDVAAVKAADALHNVRSILADLLEVGPVVWQRFKRGPAPMLGYYRGIVAGARAWLGEHELVAELEAAVEELALRA